MMPTIWLFEDQLSLDLEPLREAPGGCVLLIESAHNMSRVPYHKIRLTFLVAAMRHFAKELVEVGRTVAHYPLEERGYRDSITALRNHIKETGSTEFWVVEPSEYHTRQWLETLPAKLGLTLRYFPNTLFLTDRTEFKSWATRLKSPVMEVFYRRMRKVHDVLMEGEDPAGGEWNLDKQNRKSLKGDLFIPQPKAFPPDTITREVMAEIERRFPDHPGSTEGFALPVKRDDAEKWFGDFIAHRLPRFGDYEDAMVIGEPVLYHSMISPLLNAGLLKPMDCIRAVEQAYIEKKAPLNAVEGFVRQILGWREYVYGIYWSFMPEYRERNARGSERYLPDFFWDGKTEMNCLSQCVGSVRERAYSHHIQRLMVICNFATLAGLSPQAVNDWFLAMYVDSHDWVVTPNVIGMAMNADGGTMATKPYVSSAAYIHRMSDYCRSCRYKHTERTGDNACPFNYLYWTFLQRFRGMFDSNPRMKLILKNLERVSSEEMAEMMQLRKRFIERVAPQTTDEQQGGG